jgi:hypothetical protein
LSLAIVGVASVGVLLPLFNAGSPDLLYPSLLVLLCGVAVFTTADRDPGPSRGVEGRLRVTDDELVAQSEIVGEWALSLPRGDVVDGWLEPHTADRGRTLVLVARNGMQLRLSRHDRMADGPAAAPLQVVLRKLGLDERVVCIPLVPEHRGFRGGMGMFMGLLLVVCALMLIFVVIALFQGDTSALVMLPVMLVVFFPVLAMPHFLVANRAAGNFRRGAIQADHLLSVVSDPRATPAQRVGAAFALVAHDESSENRLREAVEGCVEPAMRRALERASLGEIDEAALARAESVAAEAS